MYSYPPWPRDAKLLMNIVRNVLENCASLLSKGTRRQWILKTSMIDFWQTRLKVREQAGLILGELGRKIVASTGGDATIENERKDLGSFWKIWGSVCSILCIWFGLLLIFPPEKRAAAQKAETNFFALLKELPFTEGLSWKEVWPSRFVFRQ